MQQQIFYSSSTEETYHIGREFGCTLSPCSVIAFMGDLGSGKTTFIRGLVEARVSSPSLLVSSPTFVYLNIYEGDDTVYHFDLYRMQSEEDFIAMGFEDYFYQKGICCIEWAERVVSILPQTTYFVSLNYTEDQKRLITIKKGK